ncbi:MAG TPA: inositol monophosphatase family protein, partial [Planctomycetaceae bacterium]|nr:inositol monophosphatase family protein [Planctomycetaceae bacterium]
MSSSDAEFLSVAVAAAHVAGQILQEWAGKFTVSEKGPADLVTEADLASQEAIYRILHERFPDHGFLGEEGLSSSPAGADYRWIIDPLDGTSN